MPPHTDDLPQRRNAVAHCPLRRILLRSLSTCLCSHSATTPGCQEPGEKRQAIPRFGASFACHAVFLVHIRRRRILNPMATAATNVSTFPLFPTLPPELWNQIWQEAFPDRVGPALFFFRTGYWRPYGSEPDLYLWFRHDLLPRVRFEMPLVIVCREARGIALVWLREQDIEIRPREGQSPVFVRAFDPRVDALCIEPSKRRQALTTPVGCLHIRNRRTYITVL